MFYLNTIEQLFLFVEQLDQLEICLPYSRLLAGIPILAVFQNLGWNSNKTSLDKIEIKNVQSFLVGDESSQLWNVICVNTDLYSRLQLKYFRYSSLLWINLKRNSASSSGV